MKTATPTETLHTCPKCKRANFTAKGLTAHRCKPAATPAQAPKPAAPDWSRAKARLADLKTRFRLTLAAQAVLGMELFALKTDLGFVGSGAHRQKPKVSVFGQPAPRTWEQWCEIELKISADGADNFIKCFEAAKAKAKKTKGNMEDLVLLLAAKPSTLTPKDLEVLAARLDKLLDGETQRSLLLELKILKQAGTLKGGGGKKGKNLTPQQLAFDLFSDVPATWAKVEKAATGVLTAKNYKLYLHQLPLHAEGSEEVGLEDLVALLEDARESLTKGDLARLHADAKEALAARAQGAAA